MRGSASPLRGAMVGCGYVSQFHLKAWSCVPHAQLVALCDRDPQRLERAGRQVPGRDATPRRPSCSTGKMSSTSSRSRRRRSRTPSWWISRPGTVPTSSARSPRRWFARTLTSMIESCDAAGVRLMIHENWRFRPWYRALRTEIDSGLIGRPIRLRIVHHDTRALRPDGFVDQPYLAAMPRLILMDMGCHLVDTARYLMGEIETVAATIGRFGQRTVGEDLAMLTVTFASGALGFFDMSWCTAPDQSRPEWALNPTVVEGTEGTLRLLDRRLASVDKPQRERGAPSRTPAAGRPGLCRRLCRHPATLHRRSPLRRRARDPGLREPEDHGHHLDGLPRGRGRSQALHLIR